MIRATVVDNYCDALTEWLCGVRPQGPPRLEPQGYGARLEPPMAAQS